jgi:hypothetical protein
MGWSCCTYLGFGFVFLLIEFFQSEQKSLQFGVFFVCAPNLGGNVSFLKLIDILIISMFI